ncbi:MAG: pseudouridine synthase [Bacteroidota bacterium]
MNIRPLLNICYEDVHLIAVNKPARMLVHKTSIDAQEKVNVMHVLRDQLGRLVYPVHRLDKPTSGILVFALNPDVAKKLTESFSDRQVQKKYLAIVRGYTSESGVIDYPLKKRIDRKDKHKTKENTPQEAVTHYTRLRQAELPFPTGRYKTSRYSLLSIQPQTGRQRQIRRHLKHIFHPIVGDTAHGDGKHNLLFRKKYNCHRLLLHAHKIAFQHPVYNKKLEIKAKLDDVFNEVLLKVFQCQVD